MIARRRRLCGGSVIRASADSGEDASGITIDCMGSGRGRGRSMVRRCGPVAGSGCRVGEQRVCRIRLRTVDRRSFPRRVSLQSPARFSRLRRRVAALTAGVVYAEPAAGSKLIWDELVLTAGEAGCEVLFPDDRGGNAGLIVKVSKPGVGADAFNGYEVSLDPQGQRLRLGRHVQAFELIRDEPCAVPVNRWISLVVRMSETRLEILVDGRSVLEYEDTQQPLREGKVGFRPWMRRAQFRDLWVVAEGQRRSIPLVEPAPDASSCVGAGSRWNAARPQDG